MEARNTNPGSRTSAWDHCPSPGGCRQAPRSDTQASGLRQARDQAIPGRNTSKAPSFRDGHSDPSRGTSGDSLVDELTRTGPLGVTRANMDLLGLTTNHVGSAVIV